MTLPKIALPCWVKNSNPSSIKRAMMILRFPRTEANVGGKAVLGKKATNQESWWAGSGGTNQPRNWKCQQKVIRANRQLPPADKHEL